MRYMPQSSRGELAAFIRFLKILYFTLLASVALYWWVLELLAADIEPAERGFVTAALMAVAGGTAAAVLYLRFSLVAPLLRGPIGEPTKQLARLRLYYILCYTLAEAVALYAFVLRFLGAGREESAVFFVAAVALFLLCYPRTPQTLGGPTG